MRKPSSGKHRNGISGVGVILRDAALLVCGLLFMALFVVWLKPTQTAAVMSHNTSVQTVSAASTTQSTSKTDSEIENTAEPTPTPDLSASPDEATVPASEETQDVSQQNSQQSANPGDFSATFPSNDTGVGALLSYQSDTIKIAITRQQAYDATYFVADVWVKNIEAFRTAFAKDTYGRGMRDMPLNTANNAQAVFAVTGDYYGARESGVVVRNGTLYRDVMGDDVCVLDIDGTMRIYQKGAFSSIENIDQSVWQAWAFGPALVENATVCDTSNSKIKVKNPRCAIGYYAPGHYCFIVVDGRQSGYSEGMSLDELANTFQSLGCQSAYNLDGGATAMMVFKGALVNHPTNGGRSSSDVICF